MSQIRVVTGLAIRELWISSRLLILLAAYVGAGAAVALIAAPLATTLTRLAIGLAIAMTVGAVIAAWSFSRERTLGRVGWLVTRAIPRSTVLLGWFAALALVSVVGVAAAGSLGWLAASASLRATDTVIFAVTVAAVLCTALGLLSLGLLCGALLRPVAASVVAAGLSVSLVVVPWLAVPRVAQPPEALSRLGTLGQPTSLAVAGAGVGLALAGIGLVVARMAFARVDL